MQENFTRYLLQFYSVIQEIVTGTTYTIIDIHLFKPLFYLEEILKSEWTVFLRNSFYRLRFDLRTFKPGGKHLIISAKGEGEVLG